MLIPLPSLSSLTYLPQFFRINHVKQITYPKFKCVGQSGIVNTPVKTSNKICIESGTFGAYRNVSKWIVHYLAQSTEAPEATYRISTMFPGVKAVPYRLAMAVFTKLPTLSQKI